MRPSGSSTATCDSGKRVESFIARLWATRRIGHLLGQIRLHGEDRELVEEIVDLAVRYGIVTPYTSFLVREDVDLFSPVARSEVAGEEFAALSTAQAPAMGKAAVDRAEGENRLREARTAVGDRREEVKAVGDKTFINRDGAWVDTTYDASEMSPRLLFMYRPLCCPAVLPVMTLCSRSILPDALVAR